MVSPTDRKTVSPSLITVSYTHLDVYKRQPEGCVILTNQACYLLKSAGDEVKVRWRVPYESSGGKGAREGSQVTGAGLAWGGGSSPTLTKELALFTDNQDVVNLIAVDLKTGKTVAKTPILELGGDTVVSVENSISVYAPDSQRASVLVCNWYGAGNAAIFNPDADSSIQSFDNLYDDNWREKGSAYLMPGVEPVSYTHLDVYKRQSENKTADGNRTAGRYGQAGEEGRRER